jgi:hypothetical protein
MEEAGSIKSNYTNKRSGIPVGNCILQDRRKSNRSIFKTSIGERKTYIYNLIGHKLGKNPLPTH